MSEPELLDVVIVGAGISGIDAAYHLQTRCPTKSYAIVEARDTMGGTWDLFRYPGIRSDSDMFTLGFPFRPWPHRESIADGASILAYIRETAEAYGIDRKIRYGLRVEHASWSSERARWTLGLREAATGKLVELACRFLFACSGYYDYDEGYTPELAGRDRFAGRIIHPQHWPADLDVTGKRVVVIGSGATAVTLVPALAEQAAHVTMLQRSPTYIISVPARDRIAQLARKLLPDQSAYTFTRWKNVALTTAFYQFCRRYPALAKRMFLSGVKRELRGAGDLADFTPSYNPWDQRVCLVPGADLFAAIRHGRASVVTDHIDTFTETGIALRSGKELAADIVVTATGLNLKVFGGVGLEVDGKRLAPADMLVYKGMMCSDVPNFAFAAGYTNASWTLKCDLTSRYVARLINHMDRHGHTKCVPRRIDPSVTDQPLIDFSSGYVQRSIASFPRQGSKRPWRLYQNYALDLLEIERARLDTPELELTS